MCSERLRADHQQIPVPFSIFPSSYRSDTVKESTGSEVDKQIKVATSSVGREGRHIGTRQNRGFEEKVSIHEEGDRSYQPFGSEEKSYIHEEDRPSQPHHETTNSQIRFERDQSYRQPYQRLADTHIDVQDNTSDSLAARLGNNIDLVEKTYRQQTSPFVNDLSHFESSRKPKPDLKFVDTKGHEHSLQHGLYRAAERVLHPVHGASHSKHRTSHEPKEEVVVEERISVSTPRPAVASASASASAPISAPAPVSTLRSFAMASRSLPTGTITIPCHHIRIGDLLILQGRPCQVIRITTSPQTGQHRYLGVDLFTKQLNEESSFVSNPSPSVYVQNMLGPVFKQYRVLDIRDDGSVVAMTESGNVKQGLPVLDQSDLLERLTASFNEGRGSVRVLVVSDQGSELAVDYKIVHGSRL